MKSPKLYIRDSGLLHALLKITDLRALSTHPVAGFSWEGFVIEQALAAVEQIDPLATAYFYRSIAGAEMDLFIEASSGKRLALEIKLSTQPRLKRVLVCASRPQASTNPGGCCSKSGLFHARQH